MRVIEADIWRFAYSGIIGIPTNGFLTRNGVGVMGAGLALQAKEQFPSISYNLGQLLKTKGNCVGWILTAPIQLLAIPVKPTKLVLTSEDQRNKIISSMRYQYKLGNSVPGFHCMADPTIIKRSLEELLIFMQENDLTNVYLPLLGCGNGGLDVQQDLFPILESLNLPDSITMVFPKRVKNG